MHKISTSSLKLYQWQSRDIIYVRELCLWFVFREIYDMKAQSMSKPSSSFFELASFVLPLWLGLIRDTNFFRSGLFKPLSEVVGPVDPLVPCLALSSQRISSSWKMHYTYIIYIGVLSKILFIKRVILLRLRFAYIMFFLFLQ